MKTSVREERLVVVSDVHLGNRLFPSAHRHLTGLMHFAGEQRYSLCINGDGIDIMQMSLGRLTWELSECYRALRRFSGSLKVFYVVGNHDILVEHFLEDWGMVITVPFLNVSSGDLRIRIDHGHMYDEMFVRFPRLYVAATVLGRWALSVNPALYGRLQRMGARAGSLRHRLVARPGRAADLPGIPGEHPSFRRTAEEISRRGFDIVTFGHTHRPGRAVLPNGAVYYNTGSWLTSPQCLVIDRGTVWFGPVADLLDGKTRCGAE